MIRIARFLRGYLGAPRLLEEEIEITVGEGRVPATLLRPDVRHALPGWLLLHGITVPGRQHPMLRRFARALAASGGVVLIPEVEPWRRLRIDPAAADAVLAAAAHALTLRDDVLPGGVSLVGFSFGATQAIITAAGDAGVGEIRSVVGFGGYCDLRRTLIFMMTGEHDWEGKRYRLEPDPYGRWIVAANYLSRTRGYGGSEALARALGELAAEAGRLGIYAADPLYDPLKADLRQTLAPGDRDLWDLLAPPAAVRPDPTAGRELAEALLSTALARHPQLDPRPVLPDLQRRLVLAHGHADHLIPFTETLRMRSHLAEGTPAHTSVTRLFAHSTEADRLPLHRYPLEMVRYIQLLHEALRP